MTESYCKLFNSILLSSIWQQDDATRLLWITLLALADKDGHVTTSVPGLAYVARIPIPSCERSLAILEAPDPTSQNPANEGRRIARVERGFLILNYPSFRQRLSKEERREYKTKWQRQQRVHTCPQVSTTVHQSPQSPHVDNVDTYRGREAEAKSREQSTGSTTPNRTTVRVQRNTHTRGSLEEVKAFCLEQKLTEVDAVACFEKWEGNGWTNGGKPIRNWQATIRSWRAQGFLPSQKPAVAGGNGATPFKRQLSNHDIKERISNITQEKNRVSKEAGMNPTPEQRRRIDELIQTREEYEKQLLS